MLLKNPEHDGYWQGLALMVYNFLVKSQKVVLLKVKIYKINTWLKNCTSWLLENLKSLKYGHLLKITFGVQT